MAKVELRLSGSSSLLRRYDEPGILRSSTPPICLTSPDGRHAAFSREQIAPLEERISRTPARTAAGAAAQLKLFAQQWEFLREDCEDDPSTMLLHNVIETIEQLSAETV
jgi:hypothetical protein